MTVPKSFARLFAADIHRIFTPDGEAQAAEGGGRSGDNGDRGTPPQKPDGEAPTGEGQPGGDPGAGGSSFTASGESMTFTVTDTTLITVEFVQGNSDGTIDDIATGSVLEVELDSQNQAVSVTVKNLNAGGGFGGSSEVTNGTAANTYHLYVDGQQVL